MSLYVRLKGAALYYKLNTERGLTGALLQAVTLYTGNVPKDGKMRAA